MEAGLSEDAVTLNEGDWTIEKILEEKKQYDASLTYEKKGDDSDQGWSLPAPSKAAEPEGFPTTSNVLCISGNGDAAEGRGTSIFVTAADRSWNQLSSSSPFKWREAHENAHRSPILSITSADRGYILSTSMSGQLMLHSRSGKLIDKVRDHLKYAVQVVSGHTYQGKWIVATAGWDQKVHIYAPEQELLENYQPNESSSHAERIVPGLLRDPIHTISTPTVPESLVLVNHVETHDLYLILSRRDSTFLYYYCIKPMSPESSSSRSSEVTYAVHETGRQNLAPHSNAWVAFTPSYLASSPRDPTLIAVATSHLPHMKLLIVRLLFPTGFYTPSNSTSAELQSRTQATQARVALAIQDKEDAAIKLHVTTLAPQTPYSNPQVVWRPGGQGVFVNSDDGVIRGIDTQSGKVVASLKGHEVGSKVRTLWAGWEDDEGGVQSKREILVSGGFDKKVLFWRVKSEE